MQNFPYQLSKHLCMGSVMKFLSPYLKGFLHYILSWTSCSACPWEGYTLKYVFKHIFLSIVLLNLITIFSFPLFGLTFLVVYMI